MEIDLPATDQQTLASLATQAGFDSVELYAAAYLAEFAQHHAVAELPPMTDADLQASLAMCDRGMEEAKAGRGRDFRESLTGIADRLGLKIDR